MYFPDSLARVITKCNNCKPKLIFTFKNARLIFFSNIKKVQNGPLKTCQQSNCLQSIFRIAVLMKCNRYIYFSKS